MNDLTPAAQQNSSPVPKIRRYLRFALIALTLLYALLAGLRTVVDLDLGWQMATGAWIVHHHAIPRTELFSYTVPGVEWIYPILSGVLFYLLFHIGGYAAISWLCALACIACAAILLVRRGPWAIVLVLLAVPVLASETMPRASLFTMVLFAAFARILLDFYEDQRVRLWLLPILMLLWVNLHLGFAAGLALLAAYLFLELTDLPFASRRAVALARLRHAWPWLAATAAATLLNPWGPRIYLALVRQWSVTRWQSVFVAEWQPVQLRAALHELGLRPPESARWWLLLFGLSLAVLLLWKRRIGPALLLLAAAYAFLRHQRMEGPAILLIVLIGGAALDRAEATGRILWRNTKVLTAATIALALLVGLRGFDLVTNRTYLRSSDITLFGTGPSWWLPQRATDFLLANHLPVNVFSSFNLSSYLVWSLRGHYPDFADGRYVPFGESLFEQQQQLTSLPLDSPQWTATANRYHIATALFPLARIYALGESPLAADCASHLWTPVFLDATAVLFLRNDAVPADTLARLRIDCQAQNLFPPPSTPHTPRQRAEQYQALANASAVYSALRRIPEARQAAGLASELAPPDMTLLFVEAQTALEAKQYGTAEQDLKQAIAQRPTDAGWYNLALLYLGEHRLEDATDALTHSAALSTRPFDRYLLLARIALIQRDPSNALKQVAHAERSSPYGSVHTPAASEFRAQLAEIRASAYFQLNQPQQALAQQQRAVAETPNDPRRLRALQAMCSLTHLPCPAH